ncbi:hypothetical protein [Arthrobacter sp. B6]|uniref:hypothetical protein n=1 Tax=Arthrobacter sp. B6 TaxID=1570137 RepID=UPI0008313997|nr:hypothetical protein [Arthrobacter sp. B6]
MAKNRESAADEQPRKGNSAPGMEGEGGQYTAGDYGDAGSVEAPDDRPEGEYPDGDYGDAGSSGTAREADVPPGRATDGQVNASDEERGPLHGDEDSR